MTAAAKLASRKAVRYGAVIAALCKTHGITTPVAELRFHPVRKWRFDFAWPEALVALEVDGGVWTQGRHTRGLGVLGDHEKLNAAAVLGWRVIRCTPSTLADGIEAVAGCLAFRGRAA